MIIITDEINARDGHRIKSTSYDRDRTTTNQHAVSIKRRVI